MHEIWRRETSVGESLRFPWYRMREGSMLSR
jgi:hypothetical protein